MAKKLEITFISSHNHGKIMLNIECLRNTDITRCIGNKDGILKKDYILGNKLLSGRHF